MQNKTYNIKAIISFVLFLLCSASSYHFVFTVHLRGSMCILFYEISLASQQ